MDRTAVVQCVPNFSEGRRPEVIEAILSAIEGCGVTLLSVAPDAEHNRTVVAFAGNPGPVARAALRGAEMASRLIDMNHHQGSYPRIGAVDVIPFVPISGCDLQECVALAREVGEAIGTQLGLPVFLYEEAATRADRRQLAHVRQGEFEGLRDLIGTDPDRTPDFGPNAIHPTAGAVAIGVRAPAIAFNVTLGTSDAETASQIARAVGELSGCQTLGIGLTEHNQVQIALKITNHGEAPLHRAFELIRQQADRYGVSLVGSEIIGLVPLDALVDVARHYLRLEGFSSEQVLEKRLMG